MKSRDPQYIEGVNWERNRWSRIVNEVQDRYPLGSDEWFAFGDLWKAIHADTRVHNAIDEIPKETSVNHDGRYEK